MKDKMNELVNELSKSITRSDLIAIEQLAKISAVIAKERVDRGMNQKEFAEFLGVSQGMISKWESDNYNFTVEALAKICSKLNMELNISMKPKHKIKNQRNEWSVNLESPSSDAKYNIRNGVA